MKKILILVSIILVSFTVVSFNQTKHYNASNTMVYSNGISGYDTHRYNLNVLSSGVLNISNTLNADKVHFTFINSETNENLMNGDEIPAGNYFLNITSTSGDSINYQVELQGLSISSSSNTNLPSINVTSPSESPFTLTTQNATNTYVSGSATGDVTKVNQYNSNDLTLGKSFSNYVKVGFGLNELNFLSEYNNRNAIIQEKQVINPGLKRLYGAGRVGTAISISKELDSFKLLGDTVVIIGYNAWADGIPAITLALNERAPILYANYDNSLGTENVNEIKRLKPSNAIIVGGTGAVSSGIETELLNIGVSNIERIKGIDRYETSINVAEKIRDDLSQKVYIVPGDNFPDGLGAAPIAQRNNGQILLTNKDYLPTNIKQYLSNNPYKEIVIVGGAVSESVETSLKQYGEVTRITGQSRFDVVANMNVGFGEERQGAVITDGYNYPDGIPGAVLAGLRNYHFLFTPGNQAHLATFDVLNQSAVSNIYLLGSTNVIDGNVENEYKNYLEN